MRRSQRRHRTVSAYRDGGRVVVLIPDQFTRAEEREWVDKMLDRLAARDDRARRTDAELTVRAIRLAGRYLADHPATGQPGQRAVGGEPERPLGLVHAGRRAPSGSPTGSCDMPEWVVDYVLLHELVHLVVPQPQRRRSGRWSTATRRPSGPAGTWKGSPRPRAPPFTKIDR